MTDARKRAALEVLSEACAAVSALAGDPVPPRVTGR